MVTVSSKYAEKMIAEAKATIWACTKWIDELDNGMRQPDFDGERESLEDRIMGAEDLLRQFKAQGMKVA